MAKSKEQQNELEVREENALTEFASFEGDSGFEEVSASTFKTPFVKILQALSPEVNTRNQAHVEGAEIGKFFNTATYECYDDLNVVVLKVVHSLVVWRPSRGGFVGRYAKHEEDKIVARQDGLKKWDKDGNDIVDSIEFFCMRIEDPSDIFIFTCSTAAFKHARSWATRLRMLKVNGKNVGVTWAGVWNVKTVEESNDKGDWFTIGGTPTFVRTITMSEKTDCVDPARELLKNARVEYKEAPEDGDEVSY
jgi:hypothetical protein